MNTRRSSDLLNDWDEEEERTIHTPLSRGMHLFSLLFCKSTESLEVYYRAPLLQSEGYCSCCQVCCPGGLWRDTREVPADSQEPEDTQPTAAPSSQHFEAPGDPVTTAPREEGTMR